MINFPYFFFKNMFLLFLNIIFRSLKLDKSLYSSKKLFEEIGIYFAIILILTTSIISIIPNEVVLNWMSLNFNLGIIPRPSFRSVIIGAFIFWIIKCVYLYFVGIILFPSKSTNCNFRKILILVAFAHAPLLLNIVIINKVLLPLLLINYIWYNITLIIGLNIVLNYKNILKSTIIVLAPIIILFLYTLKQFIFLGQGGVVS